MCRAITELIAEGREEGRLEGRLEGSLKTRQELVRSMHANGVAREQILQIAALTMPELDAILLQS